MANRAYLSLWSQDFRETAMVAQLEQLLRTVPLSSSFPGFVSLAVRAISLAEAPVDERDLRAVVADASLVARLASETLHSDCLCEIEAYWDLWTFQQGRWQLTPEKLTILCMGEDFDEHVYRERGHFCIDLGFEHLFTGHAGLLTPRPQAVGSDDVEKAFWARMAVPERLEEYREKTRENIRKLIRWREALERTLPVEQLLLWSEGEESFEAKLEEILVRQ